MRDGPSYTPSRPMKYCGPHRVRVRPDYPVQTRAVVVEPVARPHSACGHRGDLRRLGDMVARSHSQHPDAVPVDRDTGEGRTGGCVGERDRCSRGWVERLGPGDCGRVRVRLFDPHDAQAPAIGCDAGHRRGCVGPDLGQRSADRGLSQYPAGDVLALYRRPVLVGVGASAGALDDLVEGTDVVPGTRHLERGPRRAADRLAACDQPGFGSQSRTTVRTTVTLPAASIPTRVEPMPMAPMTNRCQVPPRCRTAT